MSINFSAFEIGRRALNANAYGINVTGQNIANVNTPGYSRQRAQLAETAPLGFNRLSIGGGVTVEGVQAFRDRFIETRIQNETAVAGRLAAERDALAPVEVALQGSENGNLQNALNGFFGAFRDLDANPNSAPLRTIVAAKAGNLAGSFNTTRDRLDQIRFDTDAQVRGTVEQVNSLSEQIAALNVNVRAAEAVGANSSALRDQRNVFVSQISELTGARSSENSDGTISITIGEGRALVLGEKALKLDVSDSPQLGLATISLAGEPATFDDGKLRGLQNAVTTIGGQIEVLDDLAATVVERVNTLHNSGTDLDGNVGTNLFAVPLNGNPVTAANISLNPAVSANSRLIVASPNSQPGQNGTVAGEIANLLTDKTSTVGTQTGSFTSIFGSLVSQAGEQVRSADNDLQTQAAIIAQATAQRDSVSGVSLDEEAINLLQYQKAYEAAARFIKVADEMTQTILSLAQ